MRRHIDEDEPPAAIRGRNKAADARHGFGSPLGMELTDRPMNPPVGQRQQIVRDSNKEVQLQEYQALQALADLDSPPPHETWSTESETPTPPALTQGGRQSPPDVFEQLVRRPTTSPPIDAAPAGGVIRPPPHSAGSTSSRLQQVNSERFFVSPVLSSSVSQSSPTVRPKSYYTSPMTLQALRSPAEMPPTSTGRSVGKLNPIQMGSPSTAGSGISRLSDVTTTPDRARRGDNVDSASDSDTEITEPFSDQVKSLNKLLLSTDKRLGPLGFTRLSPETDNDDLSREEEDLEEIRRHLQRELSMVDYGVLRDSPGTTTSSGSNKSKSRHSGRNEIFPDDEQINLLSRLSTPDQSKASSSPLQSSPLLKNDKPSPQENITNSPLMPTTRASSQGLAAISPSDASSSMSAGSTRNGSSSSSHAHSLSSGSSRQSSAIITSPRQTVKANTGSPMEQKETKASPLPRVLVPTQILRQKDGNSLPKSTQKERPGDKEQKQSSKTSKVVQNVATESSHDRSKQNRKESSKAPKVEDAASYISHDKSNQSSSSGSGSSGRSSKSLLERIGFRKSGSSPLAKKDGNKDGNKAAGESLSPDPTGREDAASTSASEDSIFEFEDPPSRTQSITPQDPPTAAHYKSRLTPLSQSIRQFEQQIDGSPDLEKGRRLSPTLRREIAPEPPLVDVELEPTNVSQLPKKKSGGTTQALLNSWERLFPSAGASEAKQASINRMLLPKTVERSDTVSSIDADPLSFPSDERELLKENFQSRQKVPQTSTQRPVYAAPIAIPSVATEPLRDRLLTKTKEFERLSSQSSIGSARFPSDERDPIRDIFMAKSLARPTSKPSIISTTTTDQFAGDQSIKSSQTNKTGIPEPQCRQSDYSSPEKGRLAPSSLSLTPDSRNSASKDSHWFLPDSESSFSASGQAISPIVREDDGSDQALEIVYTSSDSTTKVLFSSSGEETTVHVDVAQLAGSNHADVDQEKQDGSAEDQHTKKARSKKMRLCCVLLLLFGASATIAIILLFTNGTLEVTPPLTTSPPISLMPSGLSAITPSSSPTVSPGNSIPVPTMSPFTTPTGSPTKFTISFETAYEIIIWNGMVDDIPREAYENNLIESMDMLLTKVGDKFPSGLNRIRRRLQVAPLPSSIRTFEPVNCPKLDAQDRCETVYARITLEDAVDTWADFKLNLELAIAIGQLQFELNQVNPDSPVAIIDGVEEPEPSSSPTELLSLFPTQASPPTEVDLLTLLMEKSFDNGVALLDESSPQYRAYMWLSNNAQVGNYSEYRLLQRYALATFYFSTHGENWFFQDWWLSDADECVWYSRSSNLPCNQFGQIQNLELDYNNVNGVMPPELGFLSNSIERLVLRGGPASFSGGTIPSELGLLTLMTHFFVSGNLHSGSIPTELGAWSALEQFDVSRNNFSGAIPTQFGVLGGLNLLDLSNNKLTGRIPTELGNLTRCQWLSVQNNMLTGPIPTEIGSLRRLQSFHGGSNMLTSMPTELGHLTFLDTLSLYENLLAGNIPTEISSMRRLILLELSDNALTGPIPSELGNLFDMRDIIDLSFNHLTGTLPSELGNLDRLRVLELQHNKLSGTIPAEIAGLSRATTIRLDENDLTGTIPSEVCLVFNLTFPAFSADCSEFFDSCPCCTACCVDNGPCECRYTQTPEEFLCYQQKKVI